MTPAKADVIRETVARVVESGPRALDDIGLLTLILGDPDTAGALVRTVNARRLSEATEAEIAAVPGIGPKRARLLMAAAELGRRAWPESDEPSIIRGPEEIYQACRDIRTATREHFVGFYLNSRHAILRREVISIGSLNASIVHPREVFEPAIRVHAAALALAHNHPSGDPTPSEEDLAITRRLHEAGRLLGIELLDHVVVARDSYASFRERRLLKY